MLITKNPSFRRTSYANELQQVVAKLNGSVAEDCHDQALYIELCICGQACPQLAHDADFIDIA